MKDPLLVLGCPGAIMAEVELRDVEGAVQFALSDQALAPYKDELLAFSRYCRISVSPALCS